jgi:quercetin dioxygenase-like cupin family protein
MRRRCRRRTPRSRSGKHQCNIDSRAASAHSERASLARRNHGYQITGVGAVASDAWRFVHWDRVADPIIEAPAPARIRAARVSFEPGARTAWHTHPLGQTLHVVTGLGRVQTWGAPIREIRPGDTVWIPPGEKHWHGASPTCAMMHIAMQESLDGTHVTWMEHVTDAQYAAAVVPQAE